MVYSAIFGVPYGLPTILTGVVVPHEKISPVENYFQTWKPVISGEVDGVRSYYRKGRTTNETPVIVEPAGFKPFLKSVGGPVRGNDFGRTFNQMANSPEDGSNLNSLVIFIENQNLVLKDIFSTPQTTTRPLKVLLSLFKDIVFG